MAVNSPSVRRAPQWSGLIAMLLLIFGIGAGRPPRLGAAGPSAPLGNTTRSR